MKRKHYGVLFAILLLALINLSPSKTSTLSRPDDRGETEPAAPQYRETEQEPGKLSVAVQLPEDQFAKLEQMNQSVMDEYPLQVELTNLPAETDYTQIRQLLELGDSPDVLLLGNAWVRRFASGGYLLPAESYYPGSLNGEVLGVSLVQNEWNGYIWAVPMDTDPYVWVYHEGRLKEFATGFPAAAADWDSLIHNFKSQKSSPFLFALNYNDPYSVMSLTWQLSGQTEPDSEEALFKLNGNERQTVKRIDSLRPYLTDIRGTGGQEEVWNKLYRGEAAFALVKWSEADRHRHPNLKIRFPDTNSASGAMWIASRSFAVSARSENAEAAGTWISAITSQLLQREWYDATRQLPVKKTLYFQAARNDLPSSIPASFINEKGTPLPTGAGIPVLMERYAKLSSSFLNGEIGVDAYMDNVQNLN
ncbi:extracellular solute-binding protein [Paenibacillus sp. DYY-L-2]|uniref:extracellular solute-binding protein n=1 Tax=Paenibacillus sp. DYY-L-2 TaxID=3447013 RepID=UPI003F4F8814